MHTAPGRVWERDAARAVSGGPAFEGPPALWPSWPASSPWVTAVGGTRFEGQRVGATEVATDYFGSGGGFASGGGAAAAAWQAAAVDGYLRAAPRRPPFPPPGTIDPLGRATPDIAALGEGFRVIYAGHTSSIGGTSASTPLVAALVSLLNEARLQRGAAPMGFLNPWLYHNSAAFTDITEGTNAIGRGGGPRGPPVLKYGYNCTAGWDPVTGLGTPLFDRLLAAALPPR